MKMVYFNVSNATIHRVPMKTSQNPVKKKNKQTNKSTTTPTTINKGQTPKKKARPTKNKSKTNSINQSTDLNICSIYMRASFFCKINAFHPISASTSPGQYKKYSHAEYTTHRVHTPPACIFFCFGSGSSSLPSPPPTSTPRDQRGGGEEKKGEQHQNRDRRKSELPVGHMRFF
jgi:hypothetical protein